VYGFFIFDSPRITLNFPCDKITKNGSKFFRNFPSHQMLQKATERLR
jgi:hypothetical protein